MILPSPHALLNLESAIALSFLIALVLRSRASGPVQAAERSARLDLLFLPLLAALALAGFACILRAPFVSDDYTHISEAARSNWRALPRLFGAEQFQPGLFFRPISFLLYRLNYLWAGPHPERWHAGSILLHALDAWLLYLLCRRGLRFTRAAGLCTGLVFAVSAAAAEPVAWIDAGFDLIATGFVLAALLFTCAYFDAPNRRDLALALISAAAALLSKESAFCLPALILCIASLHPRPIAARVRSAFLLITGLCVVIFAYRWWALGGFGGYTVRGSSALDQLRTNFLPRANGLFVRLWTILLFPINWSTTAALSLKAAAAALPVIFAAAVLQTRLARRKLLACLAFTLAAALPAQKMLLIGLDLSGSRVLYLPAVGIALVWGLLLGSLPPRGRAPLLGALVAVQLVILQHNLRPWREVPESAQAACLSLARLLPPPPEPVTVEGLPNTNQGAMFLANGFPECVAMNTGVSVNRIHLQGAPGNAQFQTFRWNPTGGFTKSTSPSR